jgi:hypothetical protein
VTEAQRSTDVCGQACFQRIVQIEADPLDALPRRLLIGLGEAPAADLATRLISARLRQCMMRCTCSAASKLMLSAIDTGCSSSDSCFSSSGGFESFAAAAAGDAEADRYIAEANSVPGGDTSRRSEIVYLSSTRCSSLPEPLTTTSRSCWRRGCCTRFALCASGLDSFLHAEPSSNDPLRLDCNLRAVADLASHASRPCHRHRHHHRIPTEEGKNAHTDTRHRHDHEQTLCTITITVDVTDTITIRPKPDVHTRAFRPTTISPRDLTPS